MKKRTMDAILIKVGRAGALNRVPTDKRQLIQSIGTKPNRFVGVLAQRIRTAVYCSTHLKTFSNQHDKQIIFASSEMDDINKLAKTIETLGFKPHIFIGEF